MNKSRSADETRATVRKIIASVSPVTHQEVRSDDHLISDLGYHSLAAVELTVALNEELNIPLVEAMALQEVETVGDVEDLVLELMESSDTRADHVR